MKKQKKSFIFFWIVSAVFAISIPSCFAEGVGVGLLCLFFVVLFAFLGYRKYNAPKKATKEATISKLVSQSVPSTKQSERRSDFIATKQTEFNNSISSIPRVPVCVSSDKVTRKAPSDIPDFHFSNITKRTRIECLFPLVVIDTETTGINPRGNDIIEVSAIKYESAFAPASCYTTLLKARKPIPKEASDVNNITDDMISDKPFFSEIAASFSEYISGCNVVGHNLPFDLKFLFVCGADLPQNVKYFDTLSLAKHTLVSKGGRKWDNESGAYAPVDEYDVESYKLDTLCEYYGIFRNDAHRSLSDCYATAKLFERLIEDKMS